jgi:hypothetical protein
MAGAGPRESIQTRLTIGWHVFIANSVRVTNGIHPCLLAVYWHVRLSVNTSLFPSPTNLLIPPPPYVSRSPYLRLILLPINALKAYETRARMDLLALQLAVELLACDLRSSILIVLQLQVQELNQSQNRNERSMTARALYVFSETVGESVGLVGLRT